MRVITGKAKGHSLKWPKRPQIRPTTDLVRGAIFSTLESLAIDWSRVLDLYAGTGSLGIEALSRGAGEVDFVEREPRCCSVIKDNLHHTGLAEKAKVHRVEARKALRTLKGQYGIIFLDPPYSDNENQTILAEVASSGLAGIQTTIVIEHSQSLRPKTTYGDFQITKGLHHGDTCVSIYQFARGKN